MTPHVTHALMVLTVLMRRAVQRAIPWFADDLDPAEAAARSPSASAPRLTEIAQLTEVCPPRFRGCRGL